MTFKTRTVRSSAMVSTSPILIACPGDFSRAPLTRTWPDSTSSAAEVCAFTTRACHSHLSMRCRSVVGSLLTPGQLLLQRSELRERRVRIDRTIAFARGGARCVGAQRRPALAVAALVAVAATVVVALVAITATELAFVAILVVAVLVASILALEPAVLVLRTRRGFGATFARLAEVPAAIATGIATMTAAMAMTLTALLAVGGRLGFAFGRRSAGFSSCLRTRLVTRVAMALVARFAIVVTAGGTPDLDELGLGGRRRGLHGCCRIGRRSGFGCSSLCRSR